LINQRDLLHKTHPYKVDEIKLMNKSSKKSILTDTKNELNKNISSSNLWNGINKMFTKEKSDSSVFDNFLPDDIINFYVKISSIDHSKPRNSQNSSKPQ